MNTSYPGLLILIPFLPPSGLLFPSDVVTSPCPLCCPAGIQSNSFLLSPLSISLCLR
jgi:hypothetical protein